MQLCERAQAHSARSPEFSAFPLRGLNLIKSSLNEYSQPCMPSACSSSHATRLLISRSVVTNYFSRSPPNVLRVITISMSAPFAAFIICASSLHRCSSALVASRAAERAASRFSPENGKSIKDPAGAPSSESTESCNESSMSCTWMLRALRFECGSYEYKARPHK